MRNLKLCWVGFCLLLPVSCDGYEEPPLAQSECYEHIIVPGERWKGCSYPSNKLGGRLVWEHGTWVCRCPPQDGGAK